MEVMDIARLRKVNELASILSKNRLVANKMEAADMASNLAGRKSEQDLKKSVVDKNQYLVHEENIQEQRMQQAQQMQKPVENVVTKDELNVFYNKISLQNSMEFDKMKSLMTDLTSTISSYQKQMQSLQNELSALNQEHSQLRTEYNALSVQIIQALEQAAQPQIAENQSEVLEPVSSELVSSVQEAPQNFQQEVQEQLFSEQVAAEIAQEATEAVQEAQELNVQDQNELQVSEQVNEVNEEFNAETLDNGEFTCNETVCNETVAIADSNEELMQQSVNELESANEPYMQADMESDTQVDTVNEFSEEQFVEAENSNGQNNEQQFLSEEISAETVSLDDQQFVSNTYEELESQVQQDQEQQEQQEASTNYAEQKNLVEEENFIEPENLGVVEQQDFQQDQNQFYRHLQSYKNLVTYHHYNLYPTQHRHSVSLSYVLPYWQYLPERFSSSYWSQNDTSSFDTLFRPEQCVLAEPNYSGDT